MKQKEKIVVIGTGGHSKVVTEIMRLENKYEIYGFISADKNINEFEGVKVIGGDNSLEDLYNSGVTKAFVALGDNCLRRKIYLKINSIGFELINAIHPQSIISDRAKIGKGVCVMAGAVINPYTVIGDGVIVNTNSCIDHDCTIGGWVHIAPGCALAGNVVVGEQSFLGVGTCVIPKTNIGANVILGAGSVVVKNIKSDVKAYGVPAQVKS